MRTIPGSQHRISNGSVNCAIVQDGYETCKGIKDGIARNSPNFKFCTHSLFIIHMCMRNNDESALRPKRRSLPVLTKVEVCMIVGRLMRR